MSDINDFYVELILTHVLCNELVNFIFDIAVTPVEVFVFDALFIGLLGTLGTKVLLLTVNNHTSDLLSPLLLLPL